MALSPRLGRRTAAATLAIALISGVLLVSGAAGSLVHNLKVAGGWQPDAATNTQMASSAGRQVKAERVAANAAKKQARVADPSAATGRAQAQPSLRVGWVAVSPWTHMGDRYSVALTNGPTPQKVMVHAMIMDHRNQLNTPVLHEELQLTAGERRELSAANQYGDANHFHTRLGAENDSLTFQVTLVDSSGAETARYNQRAFNFLSRFGAGPRAPDKQDQTPHMH
jgi:hypothetical protein